MNYRLMLALLVSFALCACGDASNDLDGSPNNTPNNNGQPSGINCISMCESKLPGCFTEDSGQTPTDDQLGQIKGMCPDMCAGLTQAQTSCFKQTSCAAISTGQSIATLCPASNGGPNTEADTGTNGGTDTGTNDKCKAANYCEDDYEVNCKVVNGSPSIVKSFCSNGCKDSQCVSAQTAVTISGKFTKGEPQIFRDGSTVSTALSLTAGSLSYSPTVQQGIDIGGNSVVITIQSPDPKSCNSNFQPSLSSSEVKLSFLGHDTTPNADCSDFITAVNNNGITFTAKKARYTDPGSSPVDVTFKLTPR